MEYVVQNLIKVKTRLLPIEQTPGGKSSLRYCELLDEKDVGVAEVFISHAWKQPFTTIPDILVCGRALGFMNRSVFVWLDCFVVHQHPGPEQRADLCLIPEVIREIGSTA